jgi:hypothetical protein
MIFALQGIDQDHMRTVDHFPYRHAILRVMQNWAPP